MTPRATYRLQFHAGFTFADAEAIVPYLDSLGISHIYASPITVAAPGSTHGYDVVDPTRINPELGGEEGFRRLVAALQARGMGVIIDIVPNHMGVATGTNAWWIDVLTHGNQSGSADVFDIDWSRPILLPVLGTPLKQAIADGAIAVSRHDDRWWITAYGEHRFPIRDADQAVAGGLDLGDLLDRQHYRLAWWRTANDELNWRRFFAINELAGVRAEDPAVFERSHALYFRLYEEGLIDGVRVDHVDGLTDPATYCRRLRARLGNDAWIVVEKILGPGEGLPRDWGVDGTSGYDFMEQASAVLHHAPAAEPLGQLWHEISGRPADLAPEELLARQQLLAWQFTGQLEACVAAFTALAATAPDASGMTPAMLHRAIERLLWVFPVYRTYGTGNAAPLSDAPIRTETRRRVTPHVPPGEQPVADLILAWLAGTGAGEPGLAHEAVRRFQQLSAPIAAKALEDTAFYRYGRLLSRNDVGFDAARLVLSIPDFHAAMQERASKWPHAMLTTATHDHKRGEDTRARLAVLSAIAQRWREEVQRWEVIADPLSAGIDRGDRYMLFQSLLGAWPTTPDDDFAERIASWQTKALREAKLHSSWEAPDQAYEDRCNDLARALIAHLPFRAAMHAFLSEIAPAASRNSVAMAALRCTAPGVPDLYQGGEFDDLSLVDPDNRRPVDFGARAAALADPPPKLRLIRDLLALRRQNPALFAGGSYEPAAVLGPGKILAFERRHGDFTFRLALALDEPREATIAFPSGAVVRSSEVFATTAVWLELV